MPFNVHDGFPALDAYSALISSDDFAAMQLFSSQFLARHRSVMGYYRWRWGGNPLYSWSRQWEYPFVFESIRGMHAVAQASLKILDAGSGVTFFPWMLQEYLPDSSVSCCDYDERLSAIYAGINRVETSSVDFSCADMAQLPYPDASMDVVYCISVLEHTCNYPEIIQEFSRVLRPGGLLVLTFDVSIDGMHEISIKDSEVLLDVVRGRFSLGKEYRIGSEFSPDAVLTTSAAGEIDPTLLPWRFPLYSRIRVSLKRRRWVSWPPELSVYCLTAKKAG